MKRLRIGPRLGLAAIVSTAIVAASALTADNASAAHAEAAKPEHVHNVVLVHGAFADGSGWQGVYDRLAAKGYNVSVVQEPETSLDEDVQATRRVIAMQDGPVVLVGHSYGGLVITQAGDDPKVAALVYAAAVVPDVGESIEDLFARIPSPTHDIKPTADGQYLMIDPQKFHADFAADLPAAQADFLAHSQVLLKAEGNTTAPTAAAWKTTPSYGIVAGSDMIISPELERWEYDRAHAKITEVPGASHVVYVSHPDEVAAVIEEAANR